MKKFFYAMLPVLMAAHLDAAPYEEAEKLLDSGKADAAVEIMRQEVGKNDQDPYLLYNFGLTLYRAQHYDEAIHVFQSIGMTDDKDLQSKAALQMGNVQYRMAQKLLKINNTSGTILSMERALGYYEAANEIKAGKESTANQKTATTQFETVLLDVADGADKHAAGYLVSGNLHFEEVALRDALQARQRARELDPGNSQIPPLIASTTERLVDNLARQGALAGKEADEATDDRVIKGKRKLAVAKYDDALQFDPQNAQLTAAREDQIKKWSSFLTDEAEKQATPALQKPTPELDQKDQGDLEQAKTKLDDALALDPANARAADLLQRIIKKLVESYVALGDKAMADIATTPAAKDKLDLVKTAIDQYQKALNLDPQNQPAQEGLKKAQAMLADLYAAAGREDLAAAKKMLPNGAASLKSLSNPDLQTVVTTLQSSVLNLATAVSMNHAETSFQKSLDEAQALLDAANAETDKRNLAANGAAAAAAAAAGSAAGDNASAGAGGMLPLSLNNFGSQKPVTESKFWDSKTRDW